MKIIVTGAGGQLGSAIIAAAPTDVQVIGLDRHALDITDPAATIAIMERECPDIIVNAAAYTAVDRAEVEAGAALEVNGTAVGNLATAADQVGARLIQISTDFVFDGKRSEPYPTDAEPAPLNVYGQSKLAGERGAGRRALIVRTAWVYAKDGRNFVNTMLHLLRQRDEIHVVSDQVGTPCFAPGLAAALWKLASKEATGVLHYTDSGVASWYDFAVAVQEEAVDAGFLRSKTRIIPTSSVAYPTPALRPAYSVLDKERTWDVLGYRAPHWRVNLRHMMKEVACG